MIAGAAMRRLTVMQGETHVSDNAEVVLTTVLGSCVAACLYDPGIRLGGLNHFLLAEPNAADPDPDALWRYGSYAMKALVEEMLACGAVRGRLRARLYGGASLHNGFRDIGATNAEFARRFLCGESIALAGEDIGGANARRLEFQPSQGLARCRIVLAEPSPERNPCPRKS